MGFLAQPPLTIVVIRLSSKRSRPFSIALNCPIQAHHGELIRYSLSIRKFSGCPRQKPLRESRSGTSAPSQHPGTIPECWNMLESTPARIPLIKSSHKWTRILFIISNYKLGIWICSQPRIDINSQSNFYDVLTRPYKYLSNTLYKTTCTEFILHLVSP